MIRSSGIKVLKAELDRREYRIGTDEAEQFVETGKLEIPDALPLRSLAIVRGESERLLDSPLTVTRSVDEPGWDRVTKTTLFRNPQTLAQWAHSLPLRSPELRITQNWADGVVNKLGTQLFRAHPVTAHQLLYQQTTRAVINRMDGTANTAAFIGIHTDPPEEEGANASFALDGGFETRAGQFVAGNTLTIYACEDASLDMGVEQPPHGFMSYDGRFSLVFTNFVGQSEDTPPQ
jgi:hypothetical protein